MSCYKLNIELVDIANLILKNHDLKFFRYQKLYTINYKLLLIF
jgi:hypothetical protein